ncbi:MAG: 1,2-phenylacetyl-CoA epoxidase subunit PaaD [Burkholderiaceae bacterium]
MSEHFAAVAAGPLVHDTVARAWQVLDAVTDPEIPVVSLRELGVLRDIRQDDNGILVVITPTYSGCPAMHQMEEDIQAALVREGIAARVVTQLAPVWTTDWITEAAKQKLLDYGIAPPHARLPGQSRASPDHTEDGPRAGSAVPITLKPRWQSLLERDAAPVVCPHCGSENTTETSHFGSTACKALYRCLDCREPFDYFKPF